MALQLRPVVNWTDRFTNPAQYEASVRANLVNNNTPAIQQALRSTPAPAAVQQVAQQQNIQIAPRPTVAAPVQQQPAPNVWGAIGDFLGADAFKRTGEGIAEIINELNGNAQKERDNKLKQDQQDLELIRHYGTLIRSGDEGQKARARTALASLMRSINENDDAFRKRQEQIIERTDPVKGAGAVGELGLNVVTGGTAPTIIKNAGKLLGKEIVKTAAGGAAAGVAYGAAGTAQRQGSEANIGDYLRDAAIGGTIGGAVPVALKGAGKFLQKAADSEVTGQTAKAVTNTIAKDVAKEVKVADRVKPKVSLRAEESELTKPSARLRKGDTGDISSSLDNVDETDIFNNRNVITRVKNELGKHFVEDDNQMFGLLRRIEKETGRRGLVDQYYYDTGRIRVANAIADNRVANSEDIQKLFRGLKDYTKVGRAVRKFAGQDGKSELDRFDDYAAARAELQNYKGKKTSKSREELAGIVVNGHSEFGERFTAMNNFYKEQAKYLYENGIISKRKADYYQRNPDYIRIQRDVEDLVNQTRPGSKNPTFNSTTTKQRRKGSAREVLSPTRTLLERAQQMELEVQRNKAANNTIDVLSEYGLARRVSSSEGKNTIGRFRGGKKEFWEVPKDVKAEMDTLNPYTLGPVMQIISAPNRLLRAGATGLNVPFAAANYLRDQVGSAIQSRSTLYTHNPVTIIKSLGSAARDLGDGSTDPLWKQFEEFTGNQTVYDELRNQKATQQTLRELRTGTKGRIINRAISPVRSLEDFIGITEKATRFQNFKGEYQRVLKETGNESEALKQATLAARKNTTDFNRAGDWGRVLNSFIPYFNASIQGTRTMARSFKERPVSTSMKTIGAVALPSVAATLWNYSDPARAEAYASIDDFEKKDNWIIVGPDARQRSDGTWEGVIKIPKPQGYRDLTDPVRDVTEMFAKQGQSVDMANLLQDVLGTISGPIKTGSADQLVGSVIPQQFKPFAQAYFNKNFYTGRDIVPEFMRSETEDKSQQVYSNTSGTARALAKQFGVSPITVEQFIKDTGASIGQYGLNAVDTGAATAGLIPQDQIGGKSIAEDVSGRFMEARGDLLERNKTEGQKYFERLDKAMNDVGLDSNEKAAYQAYHEKKKNFLGEEIFTGDNTYDPATRLALYNKYPKTFEVDKRINDEAAAKGQPSNPLFSLSGDRLKKVLEKEALPPGAKDPELSNLYRQDWYAEYSNNKSKYFDAVASRLKAEGKEPKKSDNPYPETPKNVQTDMDYYNSLPSGTGQRSSWIRQNPDKWNAMTSQWAAVDAWQNRARKKRGLAATEGDEGKAGGFNNGSSSSSSSYARRSGGRGGADSSGPSINPYGYQVKRGGASIKLAAKKKSKKPVALKSVARGASKPKVSLKKATA